MGEANPRLEDGYVGQVERVARGAGVSSAGQGAGRLLGYATHACVAWMHGPAQLGFYALGITVVQVASILSQLGMDNGVVRYVAHHGAGGDTTRVRGTIIQSLAVTLAISLALSVSLFAAAIILCLRGALPALEGLPALLVFAPLVLVVFFRGLISLGLYASDRQFLASFVSALRSTLERKPVT
jgi:O-antigen/teichoic acid export membrane protein